MLTLDPDVFHCLDVQKCSWREVEPRDKVVVTPATTGGHNVRRCKAVQDVTK